MKTLMKICAITSNSETGILNWISKYSVIIIFIWHFLGHIVVKAIVVTTNLMNKFL